MVQANRRSPRGDVDIWTFEPLTGGVLADWVPTWALTSDRLNRNSRAAALLVARTPDGAYGGAKQSGHGYEMTEEGREAERAMEFCSNAASGPNWVGQCLAGFGGRVR